MTCTAGALAGLLQAELRGNPEAAVTNAQTLEKAGPSDVVYVMDSSYLRKLRKSQAGIAILPRSLGGELTGLDGKTLLLVDDPQGAFLKVLEQLRPRRTRRVSTTPSTGTTTAPSTRVTGPTRDRRPRRPSPTPTPRSARSTSGPGFSTRTAGSPTTRKP